MANALQKLVEGSSYHVATRQGWLVSLAPRGGGTHGVASFQHIVSMARRHEWRGYRVLTERRSAEIDGLVASMELELIEPEAFI